MKIFLDRYSVCQGDDTEEHDEMRRFESQMFFGAVLKYILNSGFLPKMSGERASWLVTADERPVAVVATTPDRVLCALNPKTELKQIFTTSEAPWLRFCYKSNTPVAELFAHTFEGIEPQEWI